MLWANPSGSEADREDWGGVLTRAATLPRGGGPRPRALGEPLGRDPAGGSSRGSGSYLPHPGLGGASVLGRLRSPSPASGAPPLGVARPVAPRSPARSELWAVTALRPPPAARPSLARAGSSIAQTVSGFLSSSPSRPVSLAPPSPPPAPPARSPSPEPSGSRDGGAVRQAQPPAPMAARRSQRRRGRRGEPGTALLAPLALGLGLALASLGLLLAVVSLGSRASQSAQEPSQRELTAGEDRDPREPSPQSEGPVPFLKRLVRPQRSVHPRPGQDGAQAGVDGTVNGWEEAKINSSSPLRYDTQRGQFIVTKAGLYYLYCQVHFDEGKAVYLKLDLLVDDTLALRCLEEFSATAASSLGPQLRLCQVSGLLPLRSGASLRIRTLPRAHLKAAPFLTYFGLFQVH
ncbi:tumor necrosis factor ligand superfamily member 12 isoform X2 [Erinaceus europaeus]|uniref:Tumor necrosis factor ligand superfamily member 12 isoform X2 n=1 Tax=Erinaceus europaeus TaxID=9365 RepID=A0ABM3YGV6_ERIEU|nr:tumor necrosis factor ligand superfamily member 12 isoform X2 [Erinaceus europaeus]